VWAENHTVSIWNSFLQLAAIYTLTLTHKHTYKMPEMRTKMLKFMSYTRICNIYVWGSLKIGLIQNGSEECQIDLNIISNFIAYMYVVTIAGIDYCQ
jgi:hypothetical protein